MRSTASTEQNIANLRERQTRLEGADRALQAVQRQAERAAAARPLAAEMVNTVNGLRVYAGIAGRRIARSRRS